MDDYAFDDAEFLNYYKKTEIDLQDDLDENQTIPQYINDLNEQALQDPDVIYISSDEESETEEAEEDKVSGYVEIPHTTNDEYEDSDDSYYTSNTHLSSPSTELGLEDHVSLLNVDSGSELVWPITDNARDVIVIDDDDSEEEFVRENPVILRSRNFESTRRTSKKKRRVPKKYFKRQKVPEVAPKRKVVKRLKRHLDEYIEIAPIGSSAGNIRCKECNVLTTRGEKYLLSNLSFSRGKHDPYCLGCLRLHTCAASDEEFRDIIRWLVTGKIPFYDLPPEYSFKEILSRLSRRRRWMEDRVRKNQSDGSELVTSSELFLICTESKFKCAVSGHYLYFHSTKHSRTPYWALTLDHVNPLHQSKSNPASWSGDNIQPLASVLNNIKGDYSNDELVRWHADLMRSKVIVL